MASVLGRSPLPGSEEWQPAILRARRERRIPDQDWTPIFLRSNLLTALTLLTVFLALQFLLPARLVLVGMGEAGRPSVAIGVLLAFLWLVSAVRGHLPAGRQPVRWAVGLFLLTQVVGNIVGFDRLATPGQASSADRWLIVTVGFVGVILAVTDGIRTRRELDRLLRLLLFFASVMSVVGVLQFFGVADITRYIQVPGLSVNYDLIAIGSRGDVGFSRVAGTANHYIEYGVVLALLLPLALHYALFSPPGPTRWARWLTLGVIALGIPLSISRAAVVTLGLVMILTGLVWTWRLRYNVLVLGLVAVSVFHVLNRGVLGTIRALFTNAENDPSVTARVERTDTVLALFQQRPMLGWGAGMVTPGEFLLLDNQVYMFLIAGGIVGVAAFLALFVVPYLLGRSVRLRGRDEQTRHLGHTLAVAMPTAVVVSGTFDSFSFATFVATVSILIGAIGALRRLDGTTVSRPLQTAAPGDAIVAEPLILAWQGRRHPSRSPGKHRD